MASIEASECVVQCSLDVMYHALVMGRSVACTWDNVSGLTLAGLPRTPRHGKGYHEVHYEDGGEGLQAETPRHAHVYMSHLGLAKLEHMQQRPS